MQDVVVHVCLPVFMALGCNQKHGSFWQPSSGLLAEQLGCARLMAPYQLSEARKAVKQLVGNQAV